MGLGPTALAEIVIDSPGAYSILIAYRNPHDGQRLKVRLNGVVLGTYELLSSLISTGPL